MPIINRFLAMSKPSATYRVLDRIAEKRSNGEHVISLFAGEPDFDTPEHISLAGINAIKSGYTRYSPVAGLLELRTAVIEKFRQENQIESHMDEVIVATGGKQIIFNALSATLNEGDEVIIPAPYWVSYPEMVTVCAGTPVEVICKEEDEFKLTPALLEKAITPKTRWLIFNSPSNPTGSVYTKEELLALADVIRKHPDIMVLSDDIYEHLIFDGLEYVTLAQVAPDLKPRTLTMNGVSKAYAMTGWRIGFATGPSWLIKEMSKLQGHQTSGACTLSQHAAIAALTGPKDVLSQSKSIFQNRRDRILEWLKDANGIQCHKPLGAFYIYANCQKLLGKTTSAGARLESDQDVAVALLEEKNVAVVPGSAFGLGPYLRIAYATDLDSLEEACLRIKAFCAELQ